MLLTPHIPTNIEILENKKRERIGHQKTDGEQWKEEGDIWENGAILCITLSCLKNTFSAPFQSQIHLFRDLKIQSPIL